ncbi:hypothetical protein ACH4OY_30685 [Micromonospora rubida]|uniref:Uncharacterized protein n=1 Tax=Micromonospora rubida TaxID=2697657 RepID=A0ABW7STK5_9ACTN
MTLALISDVQRNLATNPTPDGAEARSALLVAHQIGMSAADVMPDIADRWTFASLTIGECIDRLTEGMPGELTLTVDLPQLTADMAEETREPIRSLLRALADLYADAATDDTASPWRRLAWASAAQHLDRATRELP